jgi:hypothetical protein
LDKFAIKKIGDENSDKKIMFFVEGSKAATSLPTYLILKHKDNNYFKNTTFYCKFYISDVQNAVIVYNAL